MVTSARWPRGRRPTSPTPTTPPRWSHWYGTSSRTPGAERRTPVGPLLEGNPGSRVSTVGATGYVWLAPWGRPVGGLNDLQCLVPNGALMRVHTEHAIREYLDAARHSAAQARQTSRDAG